MRGNYRRLDVALCRTPGGPILCAIHGAGEKGTMTEISLKRTGELLRKLFEILMDVPEGLPARVALERLASVVQLSEYESGTYDSGRRFDKIVRFATIDCVKAGWLIKQNGMWMVTDAGIHAYRALPDPEAFYREATRLFRKWKADRSTVVPQGDDTNEQDAVQKSTRVTFEEAQEQASEEIAQHLHAMNPYDLQFLVAELLKGMGYFPSWISPRGRDGGLDIVAYSDPLGTRLPRIKVQVKRTTNRVDEDGLRSFLSLVGSDDVGLFVALGGFTRGAEESARKQESRKITLIDLDRLVELWIKFYEKLDGEARERLPLSPIYFLTPQE
jgi:restriction system protein